MSDGYKLNNNVIIGHKKIVNWLRFQFDHDRLSHAYLFVGPDNIGKTTVAENFAQFIFCEDKNKKKANGLQVCGQCRGCVLVKKGLHPNLSYVKKLVERKSIIIDQIYKLQKHLSLKSSLDNYKIVIIPQAGDLNKDAANRLLKILEEPYQKTIFILTARSLKDVLPTIHSRCQIFYFHSLSFKILDAYLKEAISDPIKRKNIISLSGGRPGKAFTYLQNPTAFNEQKKIVELALQAFKGSFLDNYRAIQARLKSDLPYNEKFLIVEGFLKLLMLIVQDAIYLKNNLKDSLTLRSYEKDIKLIANRRELKDLILINRQIIDFLKMAPYNPDLNIFMNKLNLALSANI